MADYRRLGMIEEGERLNETFQSELAVRLCRSKHGTDDIYRGQNSDLLRLSECAS